MAYDAIEPLPDPWLQTGIGCAVECNLLSHGKRRYKPQDFMPVKRKRPQSPKEQEIRLRMYFDMAAAANKTKIIDHRPK